MRGNSSGGVVVGTPTLSIGGVAPSAGAAAPADGMIAQTTSPDDPTLDCTGTLSTGPGAPTALPQPAGPELRTSIELTWDTATNEVGVRVAVPGVPPLMLSSAASSSPCGMGVAAGAGSIPALTLNPDTDLPLSKQYDESVSTSNATWQLTSTLTVSGGCRTPGATPADAAAPELSCYVALGDSYSAGEGAGDYVAGTAKSGDGCDRSENAYPVLLAKALGYSPFDGAPSAAAQFAACSGATTDAMSAPFKGEVAQLAHLRPETELVTLSIGGNDFGFAPILRLCVRHPLCSTLPKVRDLVDRGYARVRAVHAVLEDIHSRAPRARILLVLYPNFMPASGTCHYVSGLLSPITLDRDNVRWLHSEIDALYGVLRSQAYAGGAELPDVTVVSPGTAWSGHDICSRDSWFVKASLTRILGGRSNYFFHPTAAGQQALFERVLSALRMS